jgi:predicted O-linked N-acetylglucosamine transferase (SPINDLY family)
MSLEGALARHQEGRFAEAERLYREVVEREPRSKDALHLLGILALQTGRPQLAADSIRQALAIDPQEPVAQLNLGVALQQLERPEEALTAFDAALRLSPDYADALNNRGDVLLALRRPQEALASLDAAVRLNPRFTMALNNRGNALRALGRLTEALVSYEQALLVEPTFARAHSNRGIALRDLGRLPEALGSFEAALRLDPVNPVALQNCGNLLVELGRHQEAARCYEQALAHFERVLGQNGDDPEARFGRGSALLVLQRRLPDAVADFERAAQLGIDPVECLVGKSSALAHLQRHGEAAVCLAALLKFAPDRDYLRGDLLHSLRQVGRWEALAPLTEELTHRVQAGRRATQPPSLLSLVDDPQLHQICARTYAAHRHLPVPVLGPCGVRAVHPGERLRVAYLSADFREHAVSYLLVGALEQHDRRQLEVIGASLRGAHGGVFEQRVRGAFDRFIDMTPLTDRDAAQRLRELEVDIVVDLMGYTQGHRLGILAHRAAPVQVSYLGYASTLAVPYVDYLLADRIVIPPDEEGWYSEKLARLPHCYLPNDERRQIGPAPARAQAGLPEEGFVFCAFTSLYKISPEIFAIWMQLLKQVPGSVLWLRENSPEGRASLERHAQQSGVDPARVVFAAHVASAAEHLGRHTLADLYLDTTAYNAHSTACDALWAGVPVLTCIGRSLAARAAASALTAVGLPELITHSLDEYRQKALELAREPQLLKALKGRLASSRERAPLFDTKRFSRHLESAYREMHERAVRGAAPASFDVVALPGVAAP